MNSFSIVLWSCMVYSRFVRSRPLWSSFTSKRTFSRDTRKQNEIVEPLLLRKHPNPQHEQLLAKKCPQTQRCVTQPVWLTLKSLTQPRVPAAPALPLPLTRHRRSLLQQDSDSTDPCARSSSASLLTLRIQHLVPHWLYYKTNFCTHIKPPVFIFRVVPVVTVPAAAFST